MKISAIILAAAIMVLPFSSYSSQPDSNERNIKFSVDIHDMPRKIGDLLRFSWSFTLKELEDTLLQRYFDEIDDPLIGKAYFTVYPHQEFISGDSVWWGELEYDKTYSFTATYKIISESRIIGYLSLIYAGKCLKMKGKIGDRKIRPRVLFDIEGWNKREEPKLGFVAYGDDTVFVRTIDPIDDSAISNVIRKINPNTVQKTMELRNSAQCQQRYSSRVNLNIENINDGDTIALSVIPDSTLIIEFTNKYVNISRIDNRSDAEVIQNNPRQLEIKINKLLRNNIIELDLNKEKNIFLKIRQMWFLEGSFYFDDPFGTNNNPVKRADCFLLEWNGDYFEQAYINWTTSGGYFSFWTDKDTVAVLILSSNEQSFTFYATDNCFDFNYGEEHLYYDFGVAVFNPYHNNYSIPYTYTTITNLSLAGAFHIQNIIKHSKEEIDYPNFYPRVPIYYNNIDYCITQSDFYGYTIADIPGLRIRGDVGNFDMDQWDSAVVLHELGHFFQYDLAESPPNSSGSHVFYAPPSGSYIHDLYLAWDEAWASFRLAILDMPIFTNYKNTIPDTKYQLNLERPEPDVPYYLGLEQISPSASLPYYEGAHVEGSVALSLWDLKDAIDDGNYLINSQIWGHNNDYNGNEWWQGWDPIIDIFTNFDPQPNNPNHNYCWNIYEFIHGWRTMGYPVDQTFIDIFEAHNVPVFIPGDANEDENINILDVVHIINYKYKSGPAPNNVSSADVNADCAVDILDVTYLINYKFKAGPDLLVGCVNLYP